ncbi:hypothetical protein FHT79_003472 [Rhizobium sp. BK212]|uniref:hypothetical protein n=1 Tax=Rhizobium sp. BK212 TaxID=2587074 RepID=UPI00161CFC7A|nr:hypothetical protein [Rhizobium sp. BK212]MBB4216285.1 hypothetical protein [Rhizobium sp. BK212]
MPTKGEYLDAWIEWTMTAINAGYEPYLLTFMFNQMQGTEGRTTARMINLIEDVFSKLLTRIVRDPRKADIYTEYPRLIAAPDWPVRSHLKMTLEESVLNAGKHWHGIFLMPPRSRMWTSLDKYIAEKQGKYAGKSKPIMRVHAVAIETTERKAIGYAFKQLDRRRIGNDAIAIMPKTHGEMPSRSGRA